MLQTSYGNFDGDKWQRICKICFLQKYDSEIYIEMTASPGDFGLEGFTHVGKAFQCYCPDEHYSADQLYEKQRDKITADLLKLKLNEEPIKKRIGNIKFNTWYFVTPQYRKNDIIAHCTNKTKEVRGWNLSIIDNDAFTVVPADIDFLHPYLNSALTGAALKLHVDSTDPEDEDIVKYEADSGYLVKNAKIKHGKRAKKANAMDKVDKFTHDTISDFLKGSTILARFRALVPEDYERFIRIVQQETRDVEDLCLSPSSDHNQRYIEVRDDVETKLTESFENLDPRMIKDLSRYVMADWILRCPLDFVENAGD